MKYSVHYFAPPLSERPAEHEAPVATDPFASSPNPRMAKVALYVIGILDDLKAAGLVEGGKYKQSEEGKARFEELKASGFRPTDEEIYTTLIFLRRLNGGPKSEIAQERNEQ